MTDSTVHKNVNLWISELIDIYENDDEYIKKLKDLRDMDSYIVSKIFKFVRCHSSCSGGYYKSERFLREPSLAMGVFKDSLHMLDVQHHSWYMEHVIDTIRDIELDHIYFNKAETPVEQIPYICLERLPEKIENNYVSIRTIIEELATYYKHI